VCVCAHGSWAGAGQRTACRGEGGGVSLSLSSSLAHAPASQPAQRARPPSCSSSSSSSPPIHPPSWRGKDSSQVKPLPRHPISSHPPPPLLSIPCRVWRAACTRSLTFSPSPPPAPPLRTSCGPCRASSPPTLYYDVGRPPNLVQLRFDQRPSLTLAHPRIGRTPRYCSPPPSLAHACLVS
jgi:hypothetical protein